MTDLISRADAIDAVRSAISEEWLLREAIVTDIEALPSADAVHIHEDGTLEIKVPNAQKVGRVLVMDTDSHIGGGLFYPADAVQGEWEKTKLKDDMWICSACGSPLMTDDISETHFCPNCGAKMKGGDDE